MSKKAPGSKRGMKEAKARYLLERERARARFANRKIEAEKNA